MTGSWTGSWRTALRISRREVLRNKARNILIVVMLALPVFGAVAVDTLLTSGVQITAAEQLNRIVGGTDAYIEAPQPEAIYQTPDLQPKFADASPSGAADPGAGAKSAGTPAITAALPRATVLPATMSSGAFIHGPAGYANVDYWRLDVADPRLSGVYDLLSGRRAQAPDEVDLTPAAARDLGASQGSMIALSAQSSASGADESFTVVGIIQNPDATKDASVFALPAAPAAAGQSPAGWYVENPGGVGWSDVEALNKSGFPVVSRQVVQDQPARSQVAYYSVAQQFPTPDGNQRAAVTAAVSTIVIGIALLEVVLLAGPAFAVSARRREREYAVLGAAGADGRQVRRVVLADGVTLGLVAGVLGAGLGFATACAVLPFFDDLSGKVPDGVRVSVPQVLGVVVLAVVLGLCSALQPARSASRREIMATLGGRRTSSVRRRRIRPVVLGTLLIALGTFAELAGSTGRGISQILYIVGGIALIEVGGILWTPTIVTLVSRLGGILPLGPRLALRDCARNLGRTTPAVAAMFAAVAGAVAAGAYLESSAAQQRAGYQPWLLSNQIAVQVDGPAQAAQMDRAMRSVLPVSKSFVTESIASWGGLASAPDQSTVTVFTGGDPAACGPVTSVVSSATAGSGSPCGNPFNPTSYNAALIGDGQTLTDVTGADDPAADAVLAQGGAVLYDNGFDSVQDGKATLVVTTDVPGERSGTDVQTVHLYTVPAIEKDPLGSPNPGIVLSPAAAKELNVVSSDDQTLLNLDLPGRVTADQRVAAIGVLAKFKLPATGIGVQVDPGLPDTKSVINLVVLAFSVLLALAAAAIATGLALADGRADHETLSSVGGSPWTRRWLAGSTALVITGLGVLIGVPIGFLMAEGLLDVNNVGGGVSAQPGFPTLATMPFTVPWLNLGAMAVLTPLITALGAMLLSRSRTPTARRIT